MIWGGGGGGGGGIYVFIQGVNTHACIWQVQQPNQGRSDFCWCFIIDLIMLHNTMYPIQTIFDSQFILPSPYFLFPSRILIQSPHLVGRCHETLPLPHPLWKRILELEFEGRWCGGNGDTLTLVVGFGFIVPPKKKLVHSNHTLQVVYRNSQWENIWINKIWLSTKEFWFDCVDDWQPKWSIDISPPPYLKLEWTSCNRWL